MSGSPFVRVNRARLHEMIEQWADVIDGTTVDGMLSVDESLEHIPRNDLEALWRQAGVACLIGMAIYQNAETYVEHKVYGENGRWSS